MQDTKGRKVSFQYFIRVVHVVQLLDQDGWFVQVLLDMGPGGLEIDYGFFKLGLARRPQRILKPRTPLQQILLDCDLAQEGSNGSEHLLCPFDGVP